MLGTPEFVLSKITRKSRLWYCLILVHVIVCPITARGNIIHFKLDIKSLQGRNSMKLTELYI